MNVLVTGGAGYIGSHTCVELLQQDMGVVVVDNLVNSSAKAIERVQQITGKHVDFYQKDVRDREAMHAIFEKHDIDCVIHFAGLKAVGESVAMPLEYYDNNLFSTVTLCEVMRDHGVKNIVFSSSATVYSGDNEMPLREASRTGMCTNPYGWTKYMSEQILRDTAKSDNDWAIVLLRYFNPIGAHSSGLIGEDPRGIPNNLMPFISQTAIGKLSKNRNGFFLMVEGSKVDWAAHANDAATVVKEIVNFDESIAVAYNFYLSHPDETLIIVTADHNTGGMALGVEKGPKNINLRNFDFQRISLETLQRKCSEIMKSNQAITWDEMRSYLKDNFGLYGYIEVNAKRDKQLRDKFNKTFIDRKSTDEKTLYATFSEFVATVFDVLDHCTGIGWTSHNHTGDFTPVFAIGVGAEEFGGLNNNIDLPAKIRRLTGIK